jgi:integrase
MDYEDIQRVKWGDITKDHQLWTYRSKLVRDDVKKHFKIPLNNELRQLLKEIRTEEGINRKDATIFKRRDINGSFRAAVKRSGLYNPDPSQNVTFKTLRHTFASHLVKQGRHPKEVADLMGHNSIEMTMRYMHLSPNQLADAVHSLDGLTDMSQNGTKSEKYAGETRHY